jgi:Xaa-Pro aminopeptidase
MSPSLDFAVHRRVLLDRLQDDEAVLLFGAPHPLRNGDTEYRYRPDSDVWWLTGWEDPEVVVFLRPGEEPLTLFVQPKDREREVWTGIRPGIEGARRDFGADAAFDLADLDKELPRLLAGVGTLHYGFGRDAENDRVVLGAIERARRAARKTWLSVPETFHAPTRLLHELRLRKLPDELAVMREAARITGEAHRAAMAAGRPGRNEREIEAIVDFTFRDRGGDGPGYPSIVAAGNNANVLHYVKNRDPLREGDLLLLDAGCEYACYTADVTRTFPISGRFTEPQRRVYEHVLAAQEAGIAEARAGRPFRAMHEATVRRLTGAMVDLGLLKGDVDELIEKETFKKYYMHGTGHWLGIDVHDAGMYARGGQSRPLEPGMVVTVEPGLYIAADDESAPADLRGIGIRIEDDVLVTEEGPDILTKDTPKTVEEVEAACGA